MTELIFVVCSGRSGSTWLADILNHCDNAEAVHEPFGGKHVHTRESAYSMVESVDYIPDFIDRLPDTDKENYIIVDSFLRNDVIELKKHGSVIQLVRDPKKCIRSHMEREPAIQNGEYNGIVPEEGSVYYEKWDSFTNFEKFCWHWWRANEKMFLECDHIVRLEDLNKKWCYMKRFLDTFDLTLDKNVWYHLKQEPKNKWEKDFLIPHPDDWDEELEESYSRICGDLAKALFYE